MRPDPPISPSLSSRPGAGRDAAPGLTTAGTPAGLGAESAAAQRATPHSQAHGVAAPPLRASRAGGAAVRGAAGSEETRMPGPGPGVAPGVLGLWAQARGTEQGSDAATQLCESSLESGKDVVTRNRIAFAHPSRIRVGDSRIRVGDDGLSGARGSRRWQRRSQV